MRTSVLSSCPHQQSAKRKVQNANPPVAPATLTAKEKRRLYDKQRGPRMSRKKAEAAAAAQVKREKRMGTTTPMSVVQAIQKRLEASLNDVIAMKDSPARAALLSVLHTAIPPVNSLSEDLKHAPLPPADLEAAARAYSAYQARLAREAAEEEAREARRAEAAKNPLFLRAQAELQAARDREAARDKAAADFEAAEKRKAEIARADRRLARGG
jgi:hypothetical protein